MRHALVDKVERVRESIMGLEVIAGERDVTIVRLKTDLGSFTGIAIRKPDEHASPSVGYEVALGRAIADYEETEKLFTEALKYGRDTD